MNLQDVTPVVLTLNEELNVRRCLEGLAWARRVVVVDSLSSDDTESIARSFPNVAFFSRRFDTHANQWNFAISDTQIDTEWILALDADYLVAEAFTRAMAAATPGPNVGAFSARFIYCIDGRPLRASLYPPVSVLFRRQNARYIQDGHTQRVVVEGDTDMLPQPLQHDDRKRFSTWVRAQRRYMVLEAGVLRSRSFRDCSWPDRVRKLRVIAPGAAALYLLFFKGLILDGYPGIVYTFQRVVAEAILSMELFKSHDPSRH